MELSLFRKFNYRESTNRKGQDMSKFTIDGVDYDISSPSDKVKEQLNNINFVNDMIVQKNNELQVAQTAKIGYSRALKRELDKASISDD
tara:strand:+ start:251 stop:517 length:267 start_codon:yes stop_codon:yes gene_type:complete